MTARFELLGRLSIVLLVAIGACAAEPVAPADVAEAVSAEMAAQEEVAEQESALLPRDRETPQDRRIDCFDGCLSSCAGNKVCAGKCATKCAPRLPAYYCTMQDNTVNHTICTGAMYGWNLACNKDCELLGALGPLCKMGCELVYKSVTCPDARICV